MGNSQLMNQNSYNPSSSNNMIINIKEKNDSQYVRSSRKEQFMKSPQMDPFFNFKQQQNSKMDSNPSLNDLNFQNNKYGQIGDNDDQNNRTESRSGLKKAQSEIKFPKIEHERGNR